MVRKATNGQLSHGMKIPNIVQVQIIQIILPTRQWMEKRDTPISWRTCGSSLHTLFSKMSQKQKANKARNGSW